MRKWSNKWSNKWKERIKPRTFRWSPRMGIWQHVLTTHWKKKKKINPVTADDLNNTYCDMGERDSHKAFKDMKDHCKLCDKCLALICRGCYTGGSDEE